MTRLLVIWLGVVTLSAAAGPAAGQTVVVLPDQHRIGSPDQGPAVFNTFEVRTTITSTAADGKPVKVGEVVCRLDPGPVKFAVARREQEARSAEMAYQQAKLVRELAELAATEYEDGHYQLEAESTAGEVAIAEVEQQRAEDRLAHSEKLLKQGALSLGQNITDRLALQRVRMALEQAQTKRKILQQFVKPRRTKELQFAVEKARAEELLRQAAWQTAKAEADALAKQGEACTVKAPVDGVIVFAPLIEPGAVVKDGQFLFRVHAAPQKP